MFISSIDNSVYSLSLELNGADNFDCISIRIFNKSKSTGRHALDYPVISEYYDSSIDDRSYINLICKVKRKT